MFGKLIWLPGAMPINPDASFVATASSILSYLLISLATREAICLTVAT